MQLRIRKLQTFVQECSWAGGRTFDPPLRKVAATAVVENPYTARFIDDLTPMIDASAALGEKLASLAVKAMLPYPVQSYGKAAIVGLAGEQEHANALLTTTFAAPIREAVGGAKAWMSSFTKIGAPGVSIDVPLASKDALYVRSHYDGMTLSFHEAPFADEIVVIVCIANRGRLNARVGGLSFDKMKGVDGLQ